MKSSLRFAGFVALMTLIMFGCRKDADLSLTSDQLELRTTEDENDLCTRCPRLQTFSFNYLDETRSTVPGGHFLLGFSVENDGTQYPGVALRTDMYDIREETGELDLLNLNEDFAALLASLDVPLDTLNEFLPFTDYSDYSTFKYNAGFYDLPDVYCAERCNENYPTYSGGLNTALRMNANGDCIGPDSLQLCLLARDICAMHSVVDLSTFGLYVPDLIDPALPDPYVKSNFTYESPFVGLTFDNSFAQAMNFDIEEITGVDLDMVLSDCPLFQTTDFINRAVPSVYEMSYDFVNGGFSVKAEWPNGTSMASVFVAVSFFDDPDSLISKSAEDFANGFPDGVTLDYPEIADLVGSGRGPLTVLVTIGEKVSDPSIPPIFNALLFLLEDTLCVE